MGTSWPKSRFCRTGNDSAKNKNGLRPWLVVALLVPVALLNYLDRQMLATMKGSLVADIPSLTNNAQWGFVLGCFKWTYAVLSPFGGFVADRFGKRWVICASLFVWSLVTWWTGHVTSYNELVVTRALMGISEAFYIPAALALIADVHTGATRSRAIGVHMAGIYLGQILGGFMGYVADSPEHGWRWAFSACGMIGVIYALPLLAFLHRSTASEAGRVASPEPPCAANNNSTRQLSILRTLFTNRNFLLLVCVFTLPAIAGWVVRDWMPEILRERFALGQGRAGVSAILYVQLASLTGALLGGGVADRWMRLTPRGRIYASALGMSLFLPALFAVGLAPTLSLAIGGLILFGLGQGAFDANNMPILCQIVRPEFRATGYGIMNAVSICFGGFGDWGFGVLRDRSISLGLIFGCFAAVGLLSVFVVLKIRPQEDTDLR